MFCIDIKLLVIDWSLISCGYIRCMVDISSLVCSKFCATTSVVCVEWCRLPVAKGRYDPGVRTMRNG